MHELKVTRTKISATTRREVLLEACYRCGNPRCNAVITVHLHHVVHLEEHGGNERDNLLALCGYCHDMYHAGHFPREAIRHWKAMLVALNHAFSRREMDLLLFLHKSSRLIWYSGDGVLHFAGLIAAGLACFGQQAAGGVGVMGNPPYASSHQIELTTRGKLLVEAWLAGDEGAYLRLLSEPPEQV